MYIDWKDYGGIIDACQKYGDASRGGDPQLWSMALEYFSSYDDDCTEQARGVGTNNKCQCHVANKHSNYHR